MSISDHVQVPTKEFDDMKEALGRVTLELNTLKSKKGKELEKGYS